MPVLATIMELVQLLEAEGFGIVAGELLTEMSLGREVNPDSDGQPNLGTDGGDKYADLPPTREPIPEPEQLEAAVEFLRLRLVEPVRRLAAAEEIAGKLLYKQSQQLTAQPPTISPGPVRISFIQPTGDRRSDMARTEAEGRAETANRLLVALQKLRQPAP